MCVCEQGRGTREVSQYSGVFFKAETILSVKGLVMEAF